MVPEKFTIAVFVPLTGSAGTEIVNASSTNRTSGAVKARDPDAGASGCETKSAEITVSIVDDGVSTGTRNVSENTPCATGPNWNSSSPTAGFSGESGLLGSSRRAGSVDIISKRTNGEICSVNGITRTETLVGIPRNKTGGIASSRMVAGNASAGPATIFVSVSVNEFAGTESASTETDVENTGSAPSALATIVTP